jgi:Leucine-rich repeat (LRR) protein
MDTLSYRLHQCKNTNYSILDLSDLNIYYIPNIKNHPEYENIRKIDYLFLNSNNISVLQINELEQFDKITVIDVSYNNLTNIKYLPNSIIELVCKNNYLINICNLNNLIKLDCSFNKIDNIFNYEKLEILNCSDTNIKTINLKKIKKIHCNNSKMCNIDNCCTLEFIEMINSNINKIYYFNNLKKIIFSINDKFYISKKYKLLNKYIDDDIITMSLF